MAQATLWAMVEAPTPPLAPTTAMMRPTDFASGAENRLQIERTTSSVPAVFACRLHGGGGFHRLAEGLHRHARCRRNMVLRQRRCDLRPSVGVLASVADHLPASLSLALSASG